MASHPFCCQECLGTKKVVDVTTNEDTGETVLVCPCNSRAFKWSGCAGVGSITGETCTVCEKVGNDSSMVVLDYEDAPEGEEKYICSPLCLQKWILEHKKTDQ